MRFKMSSFMIAAEECRIRCAGSLFSRSSERRRSLLAARRCACVRLRGACVVVSCEPPGACVPRARVEGGVGGGHA